MMKITEETAETEASTALVVAQSSEMSLQSALHLDKHFATATRRGARKVSTRRMTWLTGNNDCLAINGKTPLESARGWFIDKPDEDEMFPDDYALVDAMEFLCEQGKARECVVVHQDEMGKPKKVPSWKLIDASLFVVCEGCPTKDEMDADATERWGVAYAGYRQGKKSAIAFFAFVKELTDANYFGLFAISLSSYLVDKMLSCLQAHEDYVLPFAAYLRRKVGESDELAFYAYALPTKCSVKTLTAGKVAGKTREVYYPVPAIPRLSARTEALKEESEAFLASVAISAELALLLEDNGRVERTIEWSVEQSKRWLTGDVSEETPGTYTGVDIDGNPITMETPF